MEKRLDAMCYPTYPTCCSLLQGAAPDGPSAYVVADVVDRTLRWLESQQFLAKCVLSVGAESAESVGYVWDMPEEWHRCYEEEHAVWGA